jgi:hypothetical protein
LLLALDFQSLAAGVGQGANPVQSLAQMERADARSA